MGITFEQQCCSRECDTLNRLSQTESSQTAPTHQPQQDARHHRQLRDRHKSSLEACLFRLLGKHLQHARLVDLVKRDVGERVKQARLEVRHHRRRVGAQRQDLQQGGVRNEVEARELAALGLQVRAQRLLRGSNAAGSAQEASQKVSNCMQVCSRVTCSWCTSVCTLPPFDVTTTACSHASDRHAHQSICWDTWCTCQPAIFDKQQVAGAGLAKL